MSSTTIPTGCACLLRPMTVGTLRVLFALFDCVIESKLLPVDLSQYTNLNTKCMLLLRVFFSLLSANALDFIVYYLFETLSKSHLINCIRKMAKHKKATKKSFFFLVIISLVRIQRATKGHMVCLFFSSTCVLFDD